MFGLAASLLALLRGEEAGVQEEKCQGLEDQPARLLASFFPFFPTVSQTGERRGRVYLAPVLHQTLF